MNRHLLFQLESSRSGFDVLYIVRLLVHCHGASYLGDGFLVCVENENISHRDRQLCLMLSQCVFVGSFFVFFHLSWCAGNWLEHCTGSRS